MAWSGGARQTEAWWSRNAPLRLRLVILVGIAMLPPGLLAFWQASAGYQSALTQLQNSLEQSAKLAASEQEHVIAAARELLTSAMTQAPARTGKALCSPALEHVLANRPQYEAAAIYDSSGKLQCSSQSKLWNASVDGHEWFRELAAGSHFLVSTVALNDNHQSVIAALRVADGSGNMSHAAVLKLAEHSFAQTYAHMSLPSGAQYALLDRNGRVIVSNGRVVSSRNGLPAPEMLNAQLKLTNQTFNARGTDGVRRIYALSTLLDEHLFVVVGVSSSVVLNPLALQFAWGIFSPLAMWVLAVIVVSIGMERLVVRWITYLERITSAYAAGHHRVRPERASDAPAEIRSLGQTFTRMADLISAREAELRESLAQKEMLVREMHHRVKNNMQLVISLLNLHARRVRDPRTENAFAEARGRINALATLHRRLYEAENLQHVDLKWFLEDLCNEIRRGGLATGRDIELIADLPNLPIGSDVAVPLGLLVTEAITNAYKHAFTGKHAGKIELVGHMEGERLCVSVRDDGVGLTAQSSPSDSSGLGRSLIDAFARQLGADLQVEVNSGTTITVRFPLKPPARQGA